jgi:hypothetical protein
MFPNIPVLHVLRPESVPRERRAFETAVPIISRCVLADLTDCGRSCSDAWIICRVADAIRETGVEFASLTHGASDFGAIADDAAHDIYCNIERVAGDSPKIFICSVLQAYRQLLEERLEAGTSLGPNEWLQLRCAFHSIIRYVCKQPPALALRLNTYESLPLEGDSPDPVRRWILGHHVFIAIVQGLILALHALKGALAEKSAQETAAAFELSIILLEGSALAFRFTSDFCAAQYENVVRPTMMPPRAPQGLSGLLSADHRYLIKTLVEMKPSFESLDPALRPYYSRFRSAFQSAYEAHKFVCARFRGDEKPSLLMKSSSKTSAVEELDHYMHKRMQMLPLFRTVQSDIDDKVNHVTPTQVN